MAKEAHVYLWMHDTEFGVNMPELDTPLFQSLAKRSDSLVLEHGAEDMEDKHDLEQVLNGYSRGNLSSDLVELKDYFFSNKRISYIGELIKDTGKSVVVELPNPVDDDEITNIFWIRHLIESGHEATLSRAHDLLSRSSEFHRAREYKVADQVLDCKGITLVLYGAGHQNLPSTIRSRGIPTHVHYPADNYPMQYSTELQTAFEQTGKVDPELFRLTLAECVVRNSIEELSEAIFSIPARRVIKEHAKHITTEHLIELPTYVGRCSMLSNISLQQIIGSYLQRENVPPLPPLFEPSLIDLAKESF